MTSVIILRLRKCCLSQLGESVIELQNEYFLEFNLISPIIHSSVIIINYGLKSNMKDIRNNGIQAKHGFSHNACWLDQSTAAGGDQLST